MKKIFTLMVMVSSLTCSVFPATWYVATDGNDSDPGTLSQPFLTLSNAIMTASAGDTILLRNGNYVSNEVRVNKNNLTIMSYPGEWAILTAVVNDENIASCIWYDEPEVTGGSIQNMEIIGGYYYGIKLESYFDNRDPSTAHLPGVSNILFKNLRVHHTGRDGFKLTANNRYINIENCEIHHTGVGPANSPNPNAEAIDVVQGHYVIVRHCYIHDISTNGFYFKGGSTDCVAEGNLVMNCNEGGILLGLATDANYFDLELTPGREQALNCKVYNNIIVNTQYAGIGFFGAKNCDAINNTIINTAQDAQAPLWFYLGESEDSVAIYTPNSNVKLLNNIVQAENTNQYAMGIRESSLLGTNQVDHNLFYGTGTLMFYDNINGDQVFSAWNTANSYNTNSVFMAPMLDAGYHLQAGSPAINAGTNTYMIFDYDNNLRMGTHDIGADEHNAGTNLTTPPPAEVIGTGIEGGLAAIEENTLQNINMLVYPNPCGEVLNIKTGPGIDIERVQIINNQGQVINATLSNSIVPTTGLAAGLYYIKISTPQGTGSASFIKQ